MAWISQFPFDSSPSGTSPSAIPAITGPAGTIVFSGGNAWANAVTGRGILIGDRFPAKTAEATPTTFAKILTNSVGFALEVLCSDTFATANPTWGMLDAGSATTAFAISVSNTGVITITVRQGGSSTVIWTSSSGAVSSGTRTYLIAVWDTLASSNNDYLRVYKSTVAGGTTRLTPASSTPPAASSSVQFATNTQMGCGGDSNDANTMGGTIYWFGVASHVPTDGEIASRAGCLLADDDTDPDTRQLDAFFGGSP